MPKIGKKTKEKKGAVAPPTLCYVRWRDAWYHEAAETSDDGPVVPSICELQEIGFLLASTDEAITLGMELPGDSSTAAGRWRIHIPRVAIVEIRTAPLDRAFRPKRPSKKADEGALFDAAAEARGTGGCN